MIRLHTGGQSVTIPQFRPPGAISASPGSSWATSASRDRLPGRWHDSLRAATTDDIEIPLTQTRLPPVLVTGATGRVGRAVVDLLIGAGVPVRALTHRPGEAALPANVEVVTGDLTVPDSLDAGLRGVSAVFLVWTVPPRKSPRGLGHQAVYGSLVVVERDLVRLMRAAAAGQAAVAAQLLATSPELALDRLERDEEFFLAECHAQTYSGDSALHAAAFSYSRDLARQLAGMGADVQARNRRGAQPLHAAVTGVPDSGNWNPQQQCEVIAYLIEVGADPNAAAAGGVTPLHRAVRNRCSDAVRVLLAAGADPHLTNDNGSTAFTLAQWTTGRGGSGMPKARVEQQEIIRILAAG